MCTCSPTTAEFVADSDRTHRNRPRPRAMSEHYYRGGVLIGNWSEDLSGSELLQRDEQPPTQAELRDHYSSVMRTTFKQVDPAYLRAQMDVKNLPRASSEVDKTMLFAHRGAGTDGISERTTYSDAWTPEAAGLQAAGSVPLSGAQLKRIAQKERWHREATGGGRDLDYSTTVKAQHSADNSLLGAKDIGGAGASSLLLTAQHHVHGPGYGTARAAAHAADPGLAPAADQQAQKRSMHLAPVAGASSHKAAVARAVDLSMAADTSASSGSTAANLGVEHLVDQRTSGTRRGEMTKSWNAGWRHLGLRKS